MKNILNTLVQKVIRGFLTSNTARTKHSNFFPMKFIFMLFPPAWKLFEAIGIWINRAFECSYLNFIFISCINNHDIIFFCKFVPVFWIYISANFFIWINVWLPHRYYFLFKSNFHSVKRL